MDPDRDPDQIVVFPGGRSRDPDSNSGGLTAEDERVLGGVLGAVIFLLLLGIFYLWWRRRNDAQQNPPVQALQHQYAAMLMDFFQLVVRLAARR